MGNHSLRAAVPPLFVSFSVFSRFLYILLLFSLCCVFSNAENKPRNSPSAARRRVTYSNFPCQGANCFNQNEAPQEDQWSGSFEQYEEPEGVKIEEGDFVKNAARETFKRAMKALVQKLQTKVKKMIDEGPPSYDQAAFRDLGCIAISSPSLLSFSGAIGLFPSALLLSISSSLPSLEAFEASCHSNITPLGVNLHDPTQTFRREGLVNTNQHCNTNAIGGIHGYCSSNSNRRRLHQQITNRNNSHQTEETMRRRSPSCSPAVYRERPFACRPGDFVGKFGFPQDVSPSAVQTELRMIQLDNHAENPCVAAEDGLTIVLSCASTRRPLACSAVKRLETMGPLEAVEAILLLLETAEKNVEVINTNKQLQAFISIISELQARINLIECGAKPSPFNNMHSNKQQTINNKSSNV